MPDTEQVTTRVVQFHPIFTVEVDIATGKMTGYFDWSGSCEGEQNQSTYEDENTPLHAVVCAVVDSAVAKTGPPVELPTLPARHVTVEVGTDGLPKSFGANVAATREELEPHLARYRKTFPAGKYDIVAVSPDTVREEGPLA